VKDTKHQLTRLLKSAASAPEPALEEPSLSLENRIIAQWRSALVSDELFEWPLLFFRRAFVCACGIVLIALAWSYHELSEPPPTHVAVAEYEMQLTFLP
jgi:hypothetical protein